MTEILKSILPFRNLKYHLVVYRDCFKGVEMIDALLKKYPSRFLYRSEAVDYAREVLQKRHRLLDHVVGEHEIQDTDGLFFRLTCHQQPNVLNSYRVWGTEERVDTNVLGIAGRLQKNLSSILADVTDIDSKVDYKKAGLHKDFPQFEEATCELQGVDYRTMDDKTKVVSISIRKEW